MPNNRLIRHRVREHETSNATNELTFSLQFRGSIRDRHRRYRDKPTGARRNAAIDHRAIAIGIPRERLAFARRAGDAGRFTPFARISRLETAGAISRTREETLNWH